MTAIAIYEEIWKGEVTYISIKQYQGKLCLIRDPKTKFLKNEYVDLGREFMSVAELYDSEGRESFNLVWSLSTELH